MELKLIPQAIACAREAFADDAAFETFQGNHSPHVAASLNAARFIANTTVCAVVGHKLADHGYAGPESGCIDISCDRCGFGYSRTYLY